MSKTTFEKLGIPYEERDGIFYPVLVAGTEKADIDVGKYGRMWIKYIKEEYPMRYKSLVRFGELEERADEVNDTAYELLDDIEAKWLKKHKPKNPNSFTEQLQLRTQTRMMAEEIVIMDEAPRFIILFGINQIALIDRNKWNEKRYLQFMMEDIYSRHEESTFMAMVVLLHKESFGINGTGKTSILKSVNLLYANIINQIVNRKELKQSLNIKLDDIKYGKTQTKLEADFSIENRIINYSRTMVRKTGKRTHNTKNLKVLASIFQDKYVSDEKQDNIPLFVNYGTNRLVLDIPVRIRTKHEFDIYSAFDKAIENQIDFRTFFEWFRNQEDYENECKVQNADLEFTDKSLEAVKKAMLAMLDECTNLRVARKPRLEMKVDKNGVGLNVSQLSDGEKCTMALFGDLARRLTIANPNLDNPLWGEGVVLIDEIELHMHPSWQRNIVRKLRETFPNIQFIITTHSPIVLSEIDDDFNVYFLQNKGASSEVIEFRRLDGFDANYILEEFMGTKSMNSKTEALITDIYKLINEKSFEEAEQKVNRLKELTDSTNKDVIRASMLIKKGRLS